MRYQQVVLLLRSLADSNRRTRFCRPLPSHSAKEPYFRTANLQIFTFYATFEENKKNEWSCAFVFSYPLSFSQPAFTGFTLLEIHSLCRGFLGSCPSCSLQLCLERLLWQPPSLKLLYNENIVQDFNHTKFTHSYYAGFD